MVMTYTPFDLAACTTNKLMLAISVSSEVSQEAGLGPGRKDVNIAFQFPPKIISDGRGGSWDDANQAPTLRDQITVYKGPKSRHIAMQWIYIVDGNQWTITKIKQQLKILRGYFVGPSFISAGQNVFSPLVIWAKLWNIGGSNVMSFRIQDVNIKHGETMVGTPDGNIFPLRSEVSLELLTWPQIISSDNGQPAAVSPAQRIIGPDWF